jgi:hypothetical protein
LDLGHGCGWRTRPTSRKDKCLCISASVNASRSARGRRQAVSRHRDSVSHEDAGDAERVDRVDLGEDLRHRLRARPAAAHHDDAAELAAVRAAAAELDGHTAVAVDPEQVEARPPASRACSARPPTGEPRRSGARRTPRPRGSTATPKRCRTRWSSAIHGAAHPARPGRDQRAGKPRSSSPPSAARRRPGRT